MLISAMCLLAISLDEGGRGDALADVVGRFDEVGEKYPKSFLPSDGVSGTSLTEVGVASTAGEVGIGTYFGWTFLGDALLWPCPIVISATQDCSEIVQLMWPLA